MTLPVLVAGGGPVGLVTALLLARWGVPTVVLEALDERAATGSRSICVQRDVLDIYHRVGCADALVAEGVTWQVGRTYYRGQELFSFTFPDPGRSAYPGFINIGQSSVERHLERAAAAEGLVSLWYGHRVVSLAQDSSSVTVRARRADGSLVELVGSHLVAADGAHSTVRSLLGLEFAGESFDDLFLIADIRASLPFSRERRFHFDPLWNPGRQVLVHPQPGSVWRIDWQVPAGFEVSADELDGLVRRIVGDAPYEVVWLSQYRFHQRLASRLRVGRVLLAGDAAHVMAPFGARGLNSGVQDAENAAWKVAFAVRGWAGAELLASYEIERGAAARENLRVTGQTMRFLVPRDAAQRARRRDVLARAVTDPAARSLVDSGRLAEPYWYLDSPLTTGPQPADFPRGAGAARPPVAGVLCPDGPVAAPGVARLRELFGRGFVVLHDGVDVSLVDGEVPVSAYRLDELDTERVLAAALDARPGRTWLVRPDGHLAAVLDDPTPAALAAAVDRARGAAHPAGSSVAAR